MPEATAEAVEKGKSGPGLLVVLLVALLAAGAAGGAVFFMTNKQDAAAADAAAVPAAKRLGPAVYVRLDPPFVANFEAKGMMRFLQVSVEVMTRDPITGDLLKTHDPLIRNDLLMLFGGQTYDRISTADGKEELRAAALEVVRKAVAAEGGDAAKVEQLYFTSFVMQ